MPQCVAITAKGTQCTAEGRNFENHCTRHFNIKHRDDVEFRVRFEAAQALAAEADRAAAAERARRAEEEAAARRAAEMARRAAHEAALRAEKIAKRARHLADVATIGPIKILEHARKAMEIWGTNNVPGYDIPKAYAALCYFASRHDGFQALMAAVIKLRFQAFNNHPDFANYRDVPVAEREEVLVELRGALAPYGEIDLMRTLVESDPIRALIANRMRAEAEERRRREALEAELARRAAFEAQLRAAPVVFQRDPEGGINLRAFAADPQSVHRSSVQNTTHKAVIALLARPVPEGIEVLSEIVAAFHDPVKVRWYGPGPRGPQEACEAAITELTNDYFNTEAFSVNYGDVIDRVWAFIREHANVNDLCTRLAQEVYEGRGMCSNGKMARLVNVLVGYDETLEIEAPREVFQYRIAALRNRPLAERESEARALFTEFNIPVSEHDAWLEPLLEPDTPAEAAPVAT